MKEEIYRPDFESELQEDKEKEFKKKLAEYNAKNPIKK